ncbi:MAG: LCP family protein [Lachnospiraceae bacterium]|jgi:LCP family protein required for cell wall assembly
MAKRRSKKASRAYKRRRTRRIVFGIEILVLLLLVGALFVYAQINGKLDLLHKTDIDVTDVGISEEVMQDENLTGYTNLALFGVDSRDGSLDKSRSDTMIIASINNDTKEVRLVSLYRDTWLDIGDDKFTKCNAAYNNGGPQKALKMINSNLDMNIEDYVTVDFAALIKTIDLLGGLDDITITEEECVHLNNYMVELKKVTGTDYDELPGEGTYHMTGIQATAYARIRYTAGDDFKRTERQRLIINKIVEKAKTSSLSTLTSIMDEIFPMVSTSLTKSEILNMGMSMLSYEMGEQSGFPFDYAIGETVKERVGADCVVPVTLQTNVEALHEFLFENEAYSPSKTVIERSQYLENKSGYHAEEKEESSEE